MIRHICMFKLKEEGKEAALKEALERVQTLKEIPGLQRFEVVTNSKEAPESNYEISLIFDFGNNTYLLIVFRFACPNNFAIIFIGVPAIAIII